MGVPPPLGSRAVEPGAGDSDAGPQDLLHLAAVVLLDGERKYTPIEVCERAGVDHATADSLWRAMGFPDVPDDEVAFTDRDVTALTAAVALQAGGTVDSLGVRQQTRVMSQALATIVAAHLEIAAGQERDPERLGAFVTDVLPALDDLLIYLYRRHLLAAVERSVLLEHDDADHVLRIRR